LLISLTPQGGKRGAKEGSQAAQTDLGTETNVAYEKKAQPPIKGGESGKGTKKSGGKQAGHKAPNCGLRLLKGDFRWKSGTLKLVPRPDVGGKGQREGPVGAGGPDHGEANRTGKSWAIRMPHT